MKVVPQDSMPNNDSIAEAITADPSRDPSGNNKHTILQLNYKASSAIEQHSTNGPGAHPARCLLLCEQYFDSKNQFQRRGIYNWLLGFTRCWA